MNNNNQPFTEEQLDFISEMMNIGAGNAATALQQMLQCPVNLIIPRVHVIPVTHVPTTFDNPASPVICVKMRMVGDVGGGLFFIVPEEHKDRLVSLVKRATPGLSRLENQRPDEMGLSVLTEIGNILGGTYLTAIHDFCGLNIYHTVPILAIDMIQSLLDEALVRLSLQARTALLIENEFIIEKSRIRTLLLLIPAAESIEALVNSLEKARKAYVSA